MKIEITVKDKTGETTLKAKGFLLMSLIHFSNHHNYIKHIIKLDKKIFGGGKIIEYYPPEYLKDDKYNYLNATQEIEKMIRHKKEKK